MTTACFNVGIEFYCSNEHYFRLFQSGGPWDELLNLPVCINTSPLSSY